MTSFQPTLRPEERSDASKTPQQRPALKFQPTLRPEERSDCLPGARGVAAVEFQPTLRPEERSDGVAVAPPPGGIVSTHAPPRRAERRVFLLPKPLLIQVSTHAPPRRAERLVSFILEQQLPPVSTHAPPRRAERRQRVPAAAHRGGGFNPRSAPKSGATVCCWRVWCGSTVFQPTLRPEERSDGEGAGAHHEAGVVSTHAPPRRAERPLHGRGARHRARTVSTHAPPRRAERPSRPTWGRRPSCFNPRSAPKSGATGRRLRSRTPPGWCFNPRSAPKSGATPGCRATSATAEGFNPRSAPKSGATLLVPTYEVSKENSTVSANLATADSLHRPHAHHPAQPTGFLLDSPSANLRRPVHWNRFAPALTR
jgi:hypothetical protein